MARAERRGSGAGSLSSPESRRPRRPAVTNSNEDLFLKLANDEPSLLPTPPDRTSQVGTSKLDRSKPSRLETNVASTRRSASAQLDVVGATPSFKAQEPSGHLYSHHQSLSAALPTYLRDPSSDRASISSDDRRARGTPPPPPHPTSSRTFSNAAITGNTMDPHSRDLRAVPVGETSASTKPKSRSIYRHANRTFDTPSSKDTTTFAPQSIRFLDQTPAMRSPTDGAESVGSTTAASTVWDELEELRLRIRRLEHSGNRARPVGAGLDDSADRPHTATTMTTNSSTSRPLKRSSPVRSPTSITTSAHPLLQSALAKAREAIDLETFRSLEASVYDATAVATLVATSESTQSLNGSSNTLTADAISQKRLRRKTESLCRSLTELCIALCEAVPQQPQRNVSRRGSHESPFQEVHMNSEQSPLTYLDERRARLDRSISAPHRASSRVSEPATDPRRHNNSSALGVRSSLLARYDRRRSSIAEEDEADTIPRSSSRAATHVSRGEHEDEDLTIRAPSRAMSEVQHSRHNPARDLQKFSRDYTARHPLPDRPTAFTRQSFTGRNQSSISVNSAQPSRSSSNPYRRLESRTASRLENSPVPSPTLAERLAQRRELQQQLHQQQVATAGQLGGHDSGYVPEEAMDSDISNP